MVLVRLVMRLRAPAMRRVAQLGRGGSYAACGFLTHDGRVVEDAGYGRN